MQGVPSSPDAGTRCPLEPASADASAGGANQHFQPAVQGDFLAAVKRRGSKPTSATNDGADAGPHWLPSRPAEERQDYGANGSTAVRTLTLVTTFWFPKSSLTIAAADLFLWLAGRAWYPRVPNREDLKLAIITREFGLALKVQLGMSDKADAKHGTAYQPSPQE
jgi:hypothetical protein